MLAIRFAHNFQRIFVIFSFIRQSRAHFQKFGKWAYLLLVLRVRKCTILYIYIGDILLYNMIYRNKSRGFVPTAALSSR